MIPNDLWYQIVRHMPLVCVDVAIVQDGRALLVRRSQPPAKDQWWVPGGRLVKGLSLAGMAWQKARWEVGLDCEVGECIYWQELYFPDGFGGNETHAVAFCYRLVPKGGVLKLDGTSYDSAWCSDPDDFWADMGEGEPQRVKLHPYVVACLKAAGL